MRSKKIPVFVAESMQGIRESKSEYVLLLNNDTIVFPEFITELDSCNRTGTGYLFMSGENASDSG